MKAFILGAGLGTRLRPLTERLPKPLVPVANRPLITYAFDHLIDELSVSEFMVNTHHCPDAYGLEFPQGKYREASLSFRHEPVLLDTAGGIDNIRDWLPAGEPFIVYNGDILTNLSLTKARQHHLASGNLVTLILRSEGDELRVGFDESNGKVVDLRGALRPDWSKRYQFTGIYFVSPEFLRFIRPGKIESVVLSFLAAIEAGEKIGGFLADEGQWSDLGERESYLDALSLVASEFEETRPGRLSAGAAVHETAKIDGVSSIGAGAEIGADVVISESAIWSGGKVESGSRLHRVVVRDGEIAAGDLANIDV
ncbi:MAG: sugar phosphate nucleotidyltransferase [Verrucomicrobiales bacterium]|nr:sugar phosphate nucleotidyltransferase [Verrucomicrobiales bacterium]